MFTVDVKQQQQDKFAIHKQTTRAVKVSFFSKEKKTLQQYMVVITDVTVQDLNNDPKAGKCVAPKHKSLEKRFLS